MLHAVLQLPEEDEVLSAPAHMHAARVIECVGCMNPADYNGEQYHRTRCPKQEKSECAQIRDRSVTSADSLTELIYEIVLTYKSGRTYSRTTGYQP